MTEPHDEAWTERDEAALSRLMQGVQPGKPAPAARDRALSVVRQEWQAAIASRQTSRRRVLAAAAVAGIAIAGAWIFVRFASTPMLVATVERIRGDVTDEGGSRLALRQSLLEAAAIETRADSGALLRLSAGLTVRLDSDTRVVLTNPTHLHLYKGTLFVAARPGTHAPLSVTTALGEVSHVGTQYLVSATRGELGVAVREGSVQFSADGVTERVPAGEMAVFIAGSPPHREPIALTDARWSWLAALPSTIAIEGRTLAEFLNWYAGETGLQIEFSDDTTRLRADSTLLHGSVDGLPHVEALAIVSASADISTSVRDDRLIILPSNR